MNNIHPVLRQFCLFCFLTTLLAGCSEPPLAKLSGAAQGTTYHISFWTPEAKDPNAIKTLVEAEFARLDKLLSNYRNDSVIEQFNVQITAEPIAIDEEIVSLVQQAQAVSIASTGCYDLTIKPLFDLWGFKAKKFSPPSPEQLQATLQQVGFTKIAIPDKNHLQKLNPNLRIDLSSIAQGYSVAKMAALLEQQGISDYMVEIGGELQTRGHKPDGQAWRIALEKPLPDERSLHKIITISQIEPLAVMTSGTYRHYYDINGKRYSHILDARTGKPVEHSTVSVTVLHNNPTLADAWSTALLCLGKSAGQAVANQAGIAALFIEQQDTILEESTSSALQNLPGVAFK